MSLSVEGSFRCTYVYAEPSASQSAQGVNGCLARVVDVSVAQRARTCNTSHCGG